MKVVITGAAGFLGSRLTKALLGDQCGIPVTELTLVDIQPVDYPNDYRVRTLALELSGTGAAEQIVTRDIDIIFHCAAIVSGHAEVDFDLGYRVNFDATRALLDIARRRNPSIKFVFTSSLGVFGGDLPPVVDDLTVVTPQNSYGAAKAMSELLINDYSRKGFVDGRIVRLPTVTVRSGTANRATTSFASGIIREPLNGVVAICPVSGSLKIWITSPETVVQNIIYAAIIPAEVLGCWRAINLPGITVSVSEMIDALKEVAGEKVAALVRFEKDEFIEKIVSTFPVKFDNTRALQLGFKVDSNFQEVIKAYVRENSVQCQSLGT